MIFKLDILLCFTLSSLYAAEPQCTTPNGKTGNCISISKCSELLDALQKLNDTQIKFVQKSKCGNDETPLVCCPVRNLDTETNKKGQDLLSNRKYCGYQRLDDYLTEKNQNRTKANIDEFPWLASLLYSPENKILCSGVLISDRYVLSAAHCIVYYPQALYKLVGVRLGEYNIQLDKDCAENAEIEDCSDPIEEYGIEKIIMPPEYATLSRAHDIGLLRLNRTVTFSDFIRPICLPFPGTKLATTGADMVFSGWGKVAVSGKFAYIKKKGLLELLPLDDCKRYYTGRRYQNITNRQTCTKAKSDTKDFSCQGDAGGPVMFSSKNQWHVEGIVSFEILCGYYYPNVNTNVVSYLDWIVENVKS